MLDGRFGATTGAPYIEGYVSFPRLNLTGPVSFLIDTGADVTTLSPEFLVRLGVHDDVFSTVKRAYGVGGQEDLFVEPAELFFHDSDTNTIVRYDVHANILPSSDQYANYPCLLGRMS